MNLPLRDQAVSTPLIQFWDKDIPDAVEPLVESVESMNPDMNYLFFDDESAAGFISNELGSDVLALYHQCAIPAMRADVFRYCFLLKFGGFYIDADYRCVQSVAPLVSSDHRGCLYQRAKGLANGLMYFRDSGDALIERILERALENIRTRSTNNVWSVTGPGVLQKLYANEKSKPLFDDFYLLEEDEFKTYFESVANLDYKLDDSHWFVARHKDICIFKDD